MDFKLKVPPAGAAYDSIALIWDRNAGEKNEYEIYMDGVRIGNTDKLYYIAEGLQPDSEYSFKVRIKGGTAFECISAKTAEKGRVINAEEYGAVGDGKTVNTYALQRAIDDCPKNGTVFIPKGIFMSGALDLHSDMTLYLDEGAFLKGTKNAEDYPMQPSRFEGWELMSCKSLINAGTLDRNGGISCRNINIRGKGTIMGGGMELGRAMTAAHNDIRARGRLISIHNCQNVSISGITVTEPPAWMIHMVYSDNITTYNVSFISSGVWNGDGWDPDSSTNCTIFGCSFKTGDDCIAIKSGKNPEGNTVNRPTRNVRIFNCSFEGGLGLAIGSEMSGGVENVDISDCVMSRTRYGIEIKATKKRGGYIKSIRVRDCTVDLILMHSVEYNDDGEAAPDAPYFSDMTFESTVVSGFSTHPDTHETKPQDTPIVLEGFDDKHRIENVMFRNIVIGNEDNANIRMRYCRGIAFDNVLMKDGSEPEYIKE